MESDGTMIFVAETEERSLYVFGSEAHAIAHCEGLDVEAGTWLFWDDAGRPLEARFSVPTQHGTFVVANGVYRLVPASPGHHATLVEALDELLHFDAAPPFDSAAGVRSHLAAREKPTPPS
jgi:hypothetical protein